MHLKKYIVALLILIMAVTALVYAEDSTVFTVEPSVSEGVVTVEVTYDGNKMMRGGGFNIVFDNNKMDLLEVIQGDAMQDTLCMVNEDFAENKIRVVWATTEDMPESGVVITAKFKVVFGNFEKTDIAFEAFEICNINGQIIKSATMEIEGVEDSKVSSGKESEPDEEETDDTQINKEEDTSEDLADEELKDQNGSAEDDDVATTLPVESVTDEDAAEVESFEFVDVANTDWFYDGVKYASENGLMSGISTAEFAPNLSLTRGMLVVVLYRLEGEPACGEPQFIDVEKGTWYTDAVAWAASEGIVNGVGDNKFEPNRDITREQIATILYKYSQKKEMVGATAVAISAPDKDQISDWAMEGMHWAVSEELITGKDGGILDPQGKATRAEIATILMRYLNKAK